jgi:hypothetical protein
MSSSSSSSSSSSYPASTATLPIPKEEFIFLLEQVILPHFNALSETPDFKAMAQYRDAAIRNEYVQKILNNALKEAADTYPDVPAYHQLKLVGAVTMFYHSAIVNKVMDTCKFPNRR